MRNPHPGARGVDPRNSIYIHVSNEKKAPGCLGYIGDEILPSYVGIMDPY